MSRIDCGKAAEMLPILTAYAQGKMIQFKHIGDNAQWEDCSMGIYPDLLAKYTSSYRIKPETVVVEKWVVLGTMNQTLSIHDTETKANQSAIQFCPIGRVVKMTGSYER